MKKLLILSAILIVCLSFQKKPTPIPPCIKTKIAGWKKLNPNQQPQSVTEYRYKGRKVYYVVLPCCDQMNELYDGNCRLLGHPDGGITGKGDGRLPDFHTSISNPRIIWKRADVKK